MDTFLKTFLETATFKRLLRTFDSIEEGVEFIAGSGLRYPYITELTPNVTQDWYLSLYIALIVVALGQHQKIGEHIFMKYFNVFNDPTFLTFYKGAIDGVVKKYEFKNNLVLKLIQTKSVV